MKYIIDTNILIDHLRGDKVAASFLEEVEKANKQAAISLITEYEIMVGVKTSAEEEKISSFLKIMPSLTITSSIVHKAAYFHRTYKTDIVDALIAATVYDSKAILLTRNIKHFNKIKEIRITSI